jgi:F-type H+-transporting ATPase subunit b
MDRRLVADNGLPFAINRRGRIVLIREYCAVAVLAVLWLPVAARAADEPADKPAEKASENHSAEASGSDAGEGGDSHGEADEGAHGGHGVGHDGVSTSVSEFQTDLAIYTFIVFLGLVGLLAKFAWGPISSGLDKREEGIRQNIADAEEIREKSAAALAEHEAKLEAVQEEVKEILAEARRDAEHTKSEIMTAAQSEAEATRDRALGEIERARDQALKDLFDQVSSQVAAATEHVLGRSLDAADQQRLIGEALAEVTSESN